MAIPQQTMDWCPSIEIRSLVQHLVRSKHQYQIHHRSIQDTFHVIIASHLGRLFPRSQFSTYAKPPHNAWPKSLERNIAREDPKASFGRHPETPSCIPALLKLLRSSKVRITTRLRNNSRPACHHYPPFPKLPTFPVSHHGGLDIRMSISARRGPRRPIAQHPLSRSTSSCLT